MSDPPPPEEKFKGYRDTSQPDTSWRGPFRPDPPRERRVAGGRGPAPDLVGADTEGTWEKRSTREQERAQGQEGSSEEGSAEEGTEEKDTEEEDAEEEGSSWEKVRQLYNDGDRGEARLLAARRARSERTFATPRHSEQLHVLDPKTMTYGPGGKQALKELLVSRLGPHYSRREAREIVARIRAETYVEGLGSPEAIPLQNGDLTLQGVLSLGDNLSARDSQPSRNGLLSGLLHMAKPSAERRFLARSGARWDPKAQCPALEDFLCEAVPVEADRRVLQEYLGYCLMHWARPYPKVLLLAGPEGSGRALFLRAVSAVIPWVSSLPPKRLARKKTQSVGDPAAPGPWVNAKMGVSAEALTELPVLNGRAGGVPAGGAGQAPAPHRVTNASAARGRAPKHIYATSGLSPLAAGDRFFRRVLLVSFPETLSPKELSGKELPGKSAPALAGRFEAERDGILQWAAKGLRRLLRGGGFSSSRSAEATRERWESLSGPIGRFKAALLEVTGQPDDVVVKEELYSRYREFCRKEGVQAETKGALTRILTEDPMITDAKRVPEPGGSQVRCYVGVGLKH